MNVIRLKNIDFYEEELKKAYFEDNKKYVVKYNIIYQIKYSENTGFSLQEIYKNNSKGVGYTLSGRYLITNANLVNDLVGRCLVVD